MSCPVGGCAIGIFALAFVIFPCCFLSAQQKYPQMDEGLALEKEGKLQMD